MSGTKPENITIAGLRGEDLAALILMVENGSMPESIQDEFQFSRSQVASASEEVRIMAKNFGGLNKFRDAVDPVIKNAATDTKPLEPMDDATEKRSDIQEMPEAKVSTEVVPEYPISKHQGIAKTSVGLRDALFKTMEDLMAGNIDPSDANAVCGVSKAICETVKLEMEAERLMATTNNGKDGPRMLRLGEIAD